jgi:hypothetical protein
MILLVADDRVLLVSSAKHTQASIGEYGFERLCNEAAFFGIHVSLVSPIYRTLVYPTALWLRRSKGKLGQGTLR